tara:strand:- start:171 stop:623 length:453 start_codon:yes stop_codon:yes gene_type:complete
MAKNTIDKGMEAKLIARGFTPEEIKAMGFKVSEAGTTEGRVVANASELLRIANENLKQDKTNKDSLETRKDMEFLLGQFDKEAIEKRDGEINPRLVNRIIDKYSEKFQDKAIKKVEGVKHNVLVRPRLHAKFENMDIEILEPVEDSDKTE